MFISLFFFFFNDTATTEIYTLSLHDALPISTSSPSRNTIDRKPSHFGSKDSEPSGICGTDFASIGATGGITGRSMRSLLRTIAVRAHEEDRAPALTEASFRLGQIAGQGFRRRLDSLAVTPLTGEQLATYG